MDQSDMWAAWFRPLALKLIASLYPDLGGPVGSGAYRILPGLGWHDEAAIRNARPITTGWDSESTVTASEAGP